MSPPYAEQPPGASPEGRPDLLGREPYSNCVECFDRMVMVRDVLAYWLAGNDEATPEALDHLAGTLHTAARHLRLCQMEVAA